MSKKLRWNNLVNLKVTTWNFPKFKLQRLNLARKTEDDLESENVKAYETFRLTD